MKIVTDNWSVPPTILPLNAELEVAPLARLFDETTNSYKFVFFLSLLDILKRNQFRAGDPIPFRDLVVEMLANSWYPHTYFRLSFGRQDQITARLDSLRLEIGEPILKFKDPDKKLLRATIAEHPLDHSLMRFVPFRLLRPFFEEELRGIPDYKVNDAIARLASGERGQKAPLYSFSEQHDAILPHPLWTEYLRVHFALIQGWAAWHWLEYMQRCNQAVPAISAKLFPPQERGSLRPQIEYWKLAIQHLDLRCIYTDSVLSADRMSLDHFLPWSFVAHHQLWNLVPTLPEVNSSKLDRLPAETYCRRLAQLQHQGLVLTSQRMPESQWERVVEPFLSDLKLADRRDLLDEQKLAEAYELCVKPQLAIAKTLGFTPNWHYQAGGGAVVRSP